ncbi:GNAT family N-acetyltransferase [halophilic archaeon]|nr:GNAT family N-acetyltransferase [halophilic archaeon]
MTSPSSVRPAEIADISAIQKVAKQSWHAAHDDIVGADAVEEFVVDHYDAESVQECIVAPNREFCVVEPKSIVGFADAGPADDRTYTLHRLYVHPDHWKDGHGSSLLAWTESALRDRGITTLQLMVMADNERAIDFYESQGFDRIDQDCDDRFDVESYVYAKEL